MKERFLFVGILLVLSAIVLLTLAPAWRARAGSSPSEPGHEGAPAAEPGIPEAKPAVPPTAPSISASALKAAVAQLEDPKRHGNTPAEPWDLRQPWLMNLPSAGLLGNGGVVGWLFLDGPATGFAFDVTVAAAGKPPLGGRVRVAGHGWRRIYIPARVLEKFEGEVVSMPAGATVRFQVSGKVPEGISVTLAGFAGAADSAGNNLVQGSNLEDDDLLAQIDWSRPALAPAAARLVQGDRSGALRELATYVRRRARHWQMPVLDESERQKVVAQADRVVRGEISAVGLNYTYPQGRIDWLFNPTTGDKASPEWIWNMNRHESWLTLGQAFKESGNPVYAEAWVRCLRRWIEQAPAAALRDEKAGSVWRDIESGLRTTRPWFESFYAMLDQPAVTDADIIRMLKGVWDHGNFLAVANWNPTNHFIFGMTGLYTVGGEFPEFVQAKGWSVIALSQLERSFAVSTLEEGGWYELAPAYGSWVCNKMLDMWDHADDNGQEVKVSEKMRAKLRSMAEWGVRLLAPDGKVPMLNDGGTLSLTTMNLPRSLRRFPESDLLRWAQASATGDTAVKPPAWTSERLPQSGYITMRSGWKSEDSYLLFDTGPLGGWHGHQDALNLVANFYGRYFLFDNGGYKYDSSIWRKWGPTTAAHNTVLVDGLGQVRNWDKQTDPIGAHPQGMPASRFGTSPRADYASAWYVSGYGKQVKSRGEEANVNNPAPASHHREVLFVKDPAQLCAVVLDTMTPIDGESHRYEVRWHLKTTSWKVDPTTRVTWTTDAGQPNLAVVSLAGAQVFNADSGVEKPEPLGWWFQGQNDEPRPALTLRQQQSAKGSVKLLTALIPFTGDSSRNPIARIETLGKNGWRIHREEGAAITVRLGEDTSKSVLTVDDVPLPSME